MLLPCLNRGSLVVLGNFPLSVIVASTVKCPISIHWESKWPKKSILGVHFILVHAEPFMMAISWADSESMDLPLFCCAWSQAVINREPTKKSEDSSIAFDA